MLTTQEPPATGRPVRWTIAFAVALLLISTAAGDLFGAQECARSQVALDSIWSVNAARSPDGNLLIVDFVAQQLVEVGLPGLSVGAVSGTAGEDLKHLRPEAIRAFDGGLLVRQSSPRQFVELNDQLGIQPGPAYQVTGRPRADGRRVESVWLFEPRGRDLVTCSDVYLGAGDPSKYENWITALVRIPLDQPAAFETLYEFGYNDRTALGCRLALPVVANLGDRSYLLALGDVPKIYEARSGAPPRELTVFPQEFAISPTLPADPGRDEVAFVYGLLEQATMPVGLFGWEGSLYLLSRSPAQRGSDWWLTRIEPAAGGNADSLAGTVQLGTHAEHLLVVPGDPYWSLVEKGPVATSYMDQDITGIVAVPAERIRSWEPGQVVCSPTS